MDFLFSFRERLTLTQTLLDEKIFFNSDYLFFVVQPSPADSMNDIVALCSVEVKHICKQFFIEILQFSWLFIVKGRSLDVRFRLAVTVAIGGICQNE